MKTATKEGGGSMDRRGLRIYCGDMREVLREFPDNLVDTVITDPPYHLTQASRNGSPRKNDPKTPHGRTKLGSKDFMGKTWDGGDVAFRPETWAEVLRVAKPGAILLAFGGTRTYHRLICAIEDAGWEIRDCMMWLYGSGFPKSMDISKAIDKAAGAEREVIRERYTCKRIKPGATVVAEGKWGKQEIPYTATDSAPSTDAAKRWNGWGTALKPAWEPIIVAMKPLDGTFAENAERWGVAGLNIAGGRIDANGRPLRIYEPGSNRDEHNTYAGDRGSALAKGETSTGRWPANLVLDEEAAAMLDEQSGTLESGKPAGVKAGGKLNCYGAFAGGIPVTGFGDIGGASRFFYTAKASKSDREPFNNHPTVKPIALMNYLCKLTATATGGIVLDPFAGSFTTGVACANNHREFIGIEIDKANVEIGMKRLAQLPLDFGILPERAFTPARPLSECAADERGGR